MKLRDHPLMTRKSGSKTWPPLWTTTHQDKEDKPIGEVGNLEDVMISYLTTNKVFMFMRYQDLRYMGFMIFEDPAFCNEIYRLLKSNLGRSIKEIGDIDLSYTL